MPCHHCWLASERSGRGLGVRCGVARKRQQSPFIRTARRGIPTTVRLKEEVMFVIGIDPHKRSHTAAVLDDAGELVGQLRVNADRWQRDRLLRFAAPFEPRTWAVEAAGGLSALLAQQLVAAGESVVDVPPTLSARVRLLDSGRTDKSDPHDARSAAIVALRHARLRAVRPVDHSAVLRLLANRHHDLTRVTDPDHLSAPRPALLADSRRFKR